MGVSTDGILCYGFRITDEEGHDIEDIDSWLCERTMMNIGVGMFRDAVAQLYGLEGPGVYDGGYDDERYEADPAYEAAWDEFWRKKDELLDDVGVTLVAHCSDNCPMYILASKASVQTARRGFPAELGQAITAQEEWREKIRAFCDKTGMPFREPQFILCSYWG